MLYSGHTTPRQNVTGVSQDIVPIMLYSEETVKTKAYVGACIIIYISFTAISNALKASWFHDNEYVQKVVNGNDTTDCVNVGGDFQHCSNLTFPITHYVNNFPVGKFKSYFVSKLSLE